MTPTYARKFQKLCKFSSPRQFLVHSGDRGFVKLFLVYSEQPPWKRLTSHPLAADERISLITTIFSDRNQIEMVRQLSGDDAQTFIDVIDEVTFYKIPRSEDRPVHFDSHYCISLDAGRPRTTDPKEMSRIVVQDVWPPRASSKSLGDPHLL